MSEVSGKLDGLRDIMAPAIPPTSGQVSWLVVMAAILFSLIVVLAIRRHRRQPHYRARRLFRQLQQDYTACKPSTCGDRLVAILRLYAGQHNLRKVALTSADRQVWSRLLEDCDRLRFSTIADAEDLIKAVMDRTRSLLWSRT